MNKKRIVFVTGASRGIGKTIAIRFLESGCKVAIGYLKSEDLANDLASKYKTIAIKVDISNRRSIQNALQETKKKFDKGVDILINNAAIAQEKPFETITGNDWDKMMTINLRGPFVFCQEVLPYMRNQKWGRIVNISSIGGVWGGFNQAHYAAAKAGLINLTKSLARIYSKDGITVNAVAPGLVATSMSVKELITPAGKEKLKNIPIGRIATPEEIAEVVVFLASEKASYITGQTINVNGGMYFG